MSEHIDGTGHPARHGYSRCARCGTWRPAGGLLLVGDAPPVCVDVAWCGRQAGVGRGELAPEAL